MTLIHFFRVIFGASVKVPQDLAQQSNLDFSNAKPASEEKTRDGDSVDNIIEPGDETTTSLLDNPPYLSLADSCCALIQELDKLKNEDNKELIEQVILRIKEGLISSGAEPIAEETAYDIIRHAAVGKSIVRKGTPIISTIEPGIAIGDKVMIKAKVQI